MAQRQRPWRNPASYQARVRSRGLFIGTRVADGAALYVRPNLLATHVAVTGTTGSGKTRWLLALSDLLARVPNASVIVINPKGSFGAQLRDQMIGNGFARRLVWFSPDATAEHSIVWNPLASNALPLATHAKAVREGLRAGWGQKSFDETPQLARYLYLALAVALEQGLTLVEAVRLLQANSPLRGDVIPMVRDPFLREALAHLDGKSAARQDDATASALARLEAFVMDPLIRRILTGKGASLDLGRVIREQKILILDIPIYAPLRADDVKLLGRLFLNDVIAHVFARPPGQRTPVFLVIDEAHLVATEDLALLLEAGRELGCFAVLSNQHLNQYRSEGSDRLFDAVMNCARTKIVFGGLSAAQLEPMVKELAITEFDPMAVKDEIKANEIIPIESRRLVVTHTTSQGRSSGSGMSEGRGTATTESETSGHTWGHSETESVFESEGYGTGVSSGVSHAIAPGGDIASESVLTFSGESSMSMRSHGRMSGTGHHAAESVQSGRSVGQSTSQQRSETRGESESSGTSWALVPFYEYLVRERVTSRQFWTEAEFLTERLKLIKGLPNSFFVVKTPSSVLTLCRAPFVPDPLVPKRRRQDALARIFAQPCYARIEDLDREEHVRDQKLISASDVVVLDEPLAREGSPRRPRR